MRTLVKVTLLALVTLVSIRVGYEQREGQLLAATAACSTSATITADSTVGGPFDGLWKYTISGSWNTGGQGLSHISFLITYACDCCNVTGLVLFDSPAGTSTGEDSLGNACTAEYVGVGDLCDADPTLPTLDPAIKFEQNATSCEAVTTGSGTWCFYSPLPPLPADTYPSAVGIKFGTNNCFGTLTGTVPDCINCLTVPTEQRTWGAIKADYGKE